MSNRHPRTIWMSKGSSPGEFEAMRFPAITPGAMGGDTTKLTAAEETSHNQRMKIDLTEAAQSRLTQHAKSAGYEDVLQYATEQLLAIAQQPTPEELPPLSKEELAESLVLIEEGEADLAAGRVQDIREALIDIGDELGFRLGD